MIEITDKSKCCGCSACANICPKECITMGFDEKGFYYPKIDASKCVSCGLCERVCPRLIDFNPNRKRTYDSVCYAACSKDPEILKTSSSGGIFWELVKYTITNHGVVYGAASATGIEVEHIRGESLEECVPMRKSKYQQSILGTTFQSVKRDLDNNRMVLFSGTSCQVAGLYGYLGGKTEHLITVDLICHGIPSKHVFNSFVKQLEMENDSKVKRFLWRNKEEGGNYHDGNYAIVEFENPTKQIKVKSAKWRFMLGFKQYLFQRPSCFECPFSSLPRIADITLGDFYSYDRHTIDSSKGVSMVIASSLDGQEVMKHILSNLEYEVLPEKYLDRRSHHVSHPARNSINRKIVYGKMDKQEYIELEKWIKNPIIKPFLIKTRDYIFRRLNKR